MSSEKPKIISEEGRKLPPGIGSANIFQLMTFSWITPMIKQAQKNLLSEEDMQELSQGDDTRYLCERLTEEWDKEIKLRPENPSLWRVLWRVYGFFYASIAILGVVESFSRLSQPILLGYLIRFFEDPTAPAIHGYLYALGIALGVFNASLFRHQFFFNNVRTGTRVRLGLIAFMYKKSLSLSIASGFSTGKVINYISNDVQPFENATPNLHYLWISPYELVFSTYFVYTNIGPAAFAAVAAVLALVPLQGYFSNRFSAFRRRMVNIRDDRISSLSDVLMGIELVKFSAWEIPMIGSIMKLRDKELNMIGKSNSLRAANISFNFFWSEIISMFAFVVFWAMGKQLSADKIFTSVAFFNQMRQVTILNVGRAVETLSESRVSAKRITEFLCLPELKYSGIEHDEKNSQTMLEMNQASFSWRNPSYKLTPTVLNKVIDGKTGVDSTSTVLRNIDFTMDREELVAVVGPVGAGKSSLCMAILRELPLTGGTFKVAQPQSRSMKIAYAAQSPWIFAGTVLDNILFGEPYDKAKFEEVIRVCELERDFELFPYAESTLIGEKGVTLSGGQKARVSLARAVYQDADLYILDDPLSAVDPQVGRGLFSNCILKYLSKKPRILVTHQLQYIKHCDRVLVLENGEITIQGPVAKVMEDNLTDSSGDIGIPKSKKFVEILREFSDENENNKSVPERGKKSESTFVIDDFEGDITKKDDNGEPEDVNAKGNTVVAEERAEGMTDPKIYIEFFRSGSSLLVLLALTLTMFSGQVAIVMSDWYLSKWSSQPFEAQRDPKNVGIYVFLVLLTSALALGRSQWFYAIMLRSTRSIFRRMMHSVVNTSISFFHTQPHGRILNRFSKDTSNVDELLPTTFFDSLQCFVSLLGTVVLSCVVEPYIIVSLPFLFAVFYYFRRLYIVASRQIKRIESTTRSPVYSLLTETLDGLTTIRAFNVGPRFMETFLDFNNENTRAFFAYIGSARWLGLRLDCVASTFITVTCFTSVASRATQSPGLVGVTFTYLLSLIGLVQWMIRQMTEVEILFVSVERMISYTKLPLEAPRITDLRPPKDWPSRAQVEFRDMSFTYPGSEQPVLKNISLTINSHEKIGIVGRTGAGKSSLLTALFRLIESHPAGCILIDDLPISEIGTQDLRTKLSIIPQEPFLFRGTLRFNLDPFNEHQDIEIWQALEAAKLKSKIENMPGGLETLVTDNGKNFSVGERQLICLGRAILRNANLIIMDEATANIDLQSDRLIQNIIKTHFEKVTVLTIAHRLNTVIGEYDRILVLDAGQVAEYGEPWELLQQSDSMLSKMVKQTGSESEAHLRSVAETRWLRVHKSKQSVMNQN